MNHHLYDGTVLVKGTGDVMLNSNQGSLSGVVPFVGRLERLSQGVMLDVTGQAVSCYPL